MATVRQLSPMMAAGIAALVACGSGEARGPRGGAGAASSAPKTTVPADRPFDVRATAAVRAGAPAAVLLVLHGYGGAEGLLDFFGLPASLGDRPVLVVTPVGGRNPSGAAFWNATGACCDFFHDGGDDVAYLDAVLDEVGRTHTIDPARVFVFGVSNGGFMAHRYACERAGRIAGVVSLAGAVDLDPARCAASQPVSVLEVHGDADDIVAFGGGSMSLGPVGGREPPPTPYPGARATAQTWATNARCGDATTGAPIDVEPDLAGAETDVTSWSGCHDAAVQLWQVHGGAHMFSWTPAGIARLWAFLDAAGAARAATPSRR